MASFNRIIMIGNLTKDPDHKQLGSGQSVCRLSIASNRPYRNKQSGEMAQEVCFVDVDVWGQQADSAKQYLQKGAPVLVEGRLKYDTWKDTDGSNRYRHSISADRVVFLGGRQEGRLSSDLDVDRAGGGAVPLYESSQDMAPVTTSTSKRGKRQGSTVAAEEVATSGSSFNFKDQQPFEDDLPF